MKEPPRASQSHIFQITRRAANCLKVDQVLRNGRNSEARRRLMTALSARISRIEAIKVADVQRVLASGEFDNYSMSPGFMLLEFPHFLNAFLDHFFLRLLDA
jgi:hypothetical protein